MSNQPTDDEITKGCTAYACIMDQANNADCGAFKNAGLVGVISTFLEPVCATSSIGTTPKLCGQHGHGIFKHPMKEEEDSEPETRRLEDDSDEESDDMGKGPMKEHMHMPECFVRGTPDTTTGIVDPMTPFVPAFVDEDTSCPYKGVGVTTDDLTNGNLSLATLLTGEPEIDLLNYNRSNSHKRLKNRMMKVRQYSKDAAAVTGRCDGALKGHFQDLGCLAACNGTQYYASDLRPTKFKLLLKLLLNFGINDKFVVSHKGLPFTTAADLIGKALNSETSAEGIAFRTAFASCADHYALWGNVLMLTAEERTKYAADTIGTNDTPLPDPIEGPCGTDLATKLTAATPTPARRRLAEHDMHGDEDYYPGRIPLLLADAAFVTQAAHDMFRGMVKNETDLVQPIHSNFPVGTCGVSKAFYKLFESWTIEDCSAYKNPLAYARMLPDMTTDAAVLAFRTFPATRDVNKLFGLLSPLSETRAQAALLDQGAFSGQHGGPTLEGLFPTDEQITACSAYSADILLKFDEFFTAFMSQNGLMNKKPPSDPRDLKDLFQRFQKHANTFYDDTVVREVISQGGGPLKQVIENAAWEAFDDAERHFSNMKGGEGEYGHYEDDHKGAEGPNDQWEDKKDEGQPRRRRLQDITSNIIRFAPAGACAKFRTWQADDTAACNTLKSTPMMAFVSFFLTLPCTESETTDMTCGDLGWGLQTDASNPLRGVPFKTHAAALTTCPTGFQALKDATPNQLDPKNMFTKLPMTLAPTGADQCGAAGSVFDVDWKCFTELTRNMDFEHAYSDSKIIEEAAGGIIVAGTFSKVCSSDFEHDMFTEKFDRLFSVTNKIDKIVGTVASYGLPSEAIIGQLTGMAFQLLFSSVFGIGGPNDGESKQQGEQGLPPPEGQKNEDPNDVGPPKDEGKPDNGELRRRLGVLKAFVIKAQKHGINTDPIMRKLQQEYDDHNRGHDDDKDGGNDDDGFDFGVLGLAGDGPHVPALVEWNMVKPNFGTNRAAEFSAQLLRNVFCLSVKGVLNDFKPMVYIMLGLISTFEYALPRGLLQIDGTYYDDLLTLIEAEIPMLATQYGVTLDSSRRLGSNYIVRDFGRTIARQMQQSQEHGEDGEHGHDDEMKGEKPPPQFNYRRYPGAPVTYFAADSINCGILPMDVTYVAKAVARRCARTDVVTEEQMGKDNIAIKPLNVNGIVRAPYLPVSPLEKEGSKCVERCKLHLVFPRKPKAIQRKAFQQCIDAVCDPRVRQVLGFLTKESSTAGKMCVEHLPQDKKGLKFDIPRWTLPSWSMEFAKVTDDTSDYCPLLGDSKCVGYFMGNVIPALQPKADTLQALYLTENSITEASVTTDVETAITACAATTAPTAEEKMSRPAPKLGGWDKVPETASKEKYVAAGYSADEVTKIFGAGTNIGDAMQACKDCAGNDKVFMAFNRMQYALTAELAIEGKRGADKWLDTVTQRLTMQFMGGGGPGPGGEFRRQLKSSLKNLGSAMRSNDGGAVRRVLQTMSQPTLRSLGELARQDMNIGFAKDASSHLTSPARRLKVSAATKTIKVVEVCDVYHSCFKQHADCSDWRGSVIGAYMEYVLGSMCTLYEYDCPVAGGGKCSLNFGYPTYKPKYCGEQVHHLSRVHTDGPLTLFSPLPAIGGEMRKDIALGSLIRDGLQFTSPGSLAKMLARDEYAAEGIVSSLFAAMFQYQLHMEQAAKEQAAAGNARRMQELKLKNALCVLNEVEVSDLAAVKTWIGANEDQVNDLCRAFTATMLPFTATGSLNCAASQIGYDLAWSGYVFDNTLTTPVKIKKSEDPAQTPGHINNLIGAIQSLTSDKLEEGLRRGQPWNLDTRTRNMQAAIERYFSRDPRAVLQTLGRLGFDFSYLLEGDMGFGDFKDSQYYEEDDGLMKDIKEDEHFIDEKKEDAGPPPPRRLNTTQCKGPLLGGKPLFGDLLPESDSDDQAEQTEEETEQTDGEKMSQLQQVEALSELLNYLTNHCTGGALETVITNAPRYTPSTDATHPAPKIVDSTCAVSSAACLFSQTTSSVTGCADKFQVVALIEAEVTKELSGGGEQERAPPARKLKKRRSLKEEEFDAFAERAKIAQETCKSTEGTAGTAGRSGNAIGSNDREFRASNGTQSAAATAEDLIFQQLCATTKSPECYDTPACAPCVLGAVKGLCAMQAAEDKLDFCSPELILSTVFSFAFSQAGIAQTPVCIKEAGLWPEGASEPNFDDIIFVSDALDFALNFNECMFRRAMLWVAVTLQEAKALAADDQSTAAMALREKVWYARPVCDMFDAVCFDFFQNQGLAMYYSSLFRLDRESQQFKNAERGIIAASVACGQVREGYDGAGTPADDKDEDLTEEQLFKKEVCDAPELENPFMNDPPNGDVCFASSQKKLCDGNSCSWDYNLTLSGTAQIPRAYFDQYGEFLNQCEEEKEEETEEEARRRMQGRRVQQGNSTTNSTVDKTDSGDKTAAPKKCLTNVVAPSFMTYLNAQMEQAWQRSEFKPTDADAKFDLRLEQSQVITLYSHADPYNYQWHSFNVAFQITATSYNQAQLLSRLMKNIHRNKIGQTFTRIQKITIDRIWAEPVYCYFNAGPDAEPVQDSCSNIAQRTFQAVQAILEPSANNPFEACNVTFDTAYEAIAADYNSYEPPAALQSKIDIQLDADGNPIETNEDIDAVQAELAEHRDNYFKELEGRETEASLARDQCNIEAFLGTKETAAQLAVCDLLQSSDSTGPCADELVKEAALTFRVDSTVLQPLIDAASASCESAKEDLATKAVEKYTFVGSILQPMKITGSGQAGYATQAAAQAAVVAFGADPALKAAMLNTINSFGDFAPELATYVGSLDGANVGVAIANKTDGTPDITFVAVIDSSSVGTGSETGNGTARRLQDTTSTDTTNTDTTSKLYAALFKTRTTFTIVVDDVKTTGSIGSAVNSPAFKIGINNVFASGDVGTVLRNAGAVTSGTPSVGYTIAAGVVDVETAIDQGIAPTGDEEISASTVSLFAFFVLALRFF